MRGNAALALLGVAVGVLAGVGGYTFLYAEGLSYMSSDPQACVNCHIMRPQYDSWQKSSHHDVAKCVDCHLPHDFIGKYIAKAENGWHHSKGFTLQDFHEPIMIKPKNAAILQANCLACSGGSTSSPPRTRWASTRRRRRRWCSVKRPITRARANSLRCAGTSRRRPRSRPSSGVPMDPATGGRLRR